jgi:hypothetical protein
MERAWSWSELAELTHATQLENFGFCTCEDGPAVFTDCPSAELPIPYTLTDKGVSAAR